MYLRDNRNGDLLTLNSHQWPTKSVDNLPLYDYY